MEGDASHCAGSDALFRVQLAQSDEGHKLKVVAKLDLVDTAGFSAKGKNARLGKNQKCHFQTEEQCWSEWLFRAQLNLSLS